MSAADDEILERIASVIRETFRLPQHHVVTRATTSADVAGWDSLSHSILIMGIEDQFAIELPIERVFGLHDVGELVDLVRMTADQRNVS
jgi:acyl carrier protein